MFTHESVKIENKRLLSTKPSPKCIAYSEKIL